MIYSGKLSSSVYKPSDGVPFDFRSMEEGSDIAVEYDDSNAFPTLIVQDDSPWKVWAKVSPDSISSGLAVYTYDSIVSSYSSAYKAAYGKAPAKALDNAVQLFISAEGANKCEVSKVLYRTPKAAAPDLADCRITLSETSYTYDGTKHEPQVTVTYKDEKLTKDTDYTVEYSGGTEVGKASVTVTAMGDYTGSAKLVYNIDPADVSGYRLGDVNFDGSINVTDVMLVSANVKNITQLNGSRRSAADINDDGQITVTDVSMLAAYVKNIRSLPTVDTEG